MAITSFRRCSIFAFGLWLCWGSFVFSALAQSAATLPPDEIVGTTPYDDTIKKLTQKSVPKVMNGDKAAEGAYPWQVALIMSPVNDPLKGFFCSGSIYSDTWIVTAAHCMFTKVPPDAPNGKLTVLLPDQMRVIYGVNTLEADLPQQKVRKVVVHDRFNTRTFDNDIALIQLTSPVASGSQATPVRLASLDQEGNILRPGAQLAITGWGATSPAGEHARLPVRQLQDGMVQFVQPKICSNYLDGSTITANMICTYSMYVDGCSGDSGGPVVPYRSGSDAKLVGIFSGSWVGACNNRAYQRHTRVATFVAWIEKCSTTPDNCLAWKP
jgi:secreted trypsin-like serine protease